MKAHELSERWRARLVAHAESLDASGPKSLGASAFRNQTVRLSFPDRSNAEFRWAFCLKDEEAQEIAVFTEHCGHHVFPLVETRVEVFETPQGSTAAVTTKEELLDRMFQLLDDADAVEWPSQTPYSFIQQMAQWLEQAHAQGFETREPTWDLLARMLEAGPGREG